MEQELVRGRLASQEDLEKRRFDRVINPLLSLIELAKSATKPLDIGCCRFCLEDVPPPLYEVADRKFICGRCRDVARACETEEQKQQFADFIYVRSAANLIENPDGFGCENHLAPTYCTDCCTLFGTGYRGRLYALGLPALICNECALDVEAQKTADLANTSKKFTFRPHDVPKYIECVAGER